MITVFFYPKGNKSSDKLRNGKDKMTTVKNLLGACSIAIERQRRFELFEGAVRRSLEDLSGDVVNTAFFRGKALESGEFVVVTCVKGSQERVEDSELNDTWEGAPGNKKSDSRIRYSPYGKSNKAGEVRRKYCVDAKDNHYSVYVLMGDVQPARICCL